MIFRTNPRAHIWRSQLYRFNWHFIESTGSTRRHRVTGSLTLIWPAMAAAFLASLVEAVEALTVVLAVASVRGRAPAGVGAVGSPVGVALILAALCTPLPFWPPGPLQRL